MEHRDKNIPNVYSLYMFIQNSHFIQSINQTNKKELAWLMNMLCHKSQIKCYLKQNLISTPLF